MAEIHGNAGSVTFGAITAGVKSWTLSWDAEAHDITDFGDTTIRVFMAGLTTWSATVECQLDAVNTAEPGATGELILSVTALIDYTGQAILTGMSVSTASDGIVMVSYSFQGSDTLLAAYS